MFKGFTNRCKKIINQYTLFELERYGHTVIQPEHILIAILKEGQSNAYTVMSEIIDLIHFQFILESHTSKMKDDIPSQNTGALVFYNMALEQSISERTKAIFQQAINEANKIGAHQVDTFTLFLACCEEEGSVARAIIMRHEVMLDDIRGNYYRYIRQDNKNASFSSSHVPPQVSRNDISQSSEIKELHFKKLMKELDINSDNLIEMKKQISDEKHKLQSSIESKKKSKEAPKEKTIEYLRDITTLAEHGAYTHIYGREEEITQICKVLLRKQKNNPVLVGEPGVGKSAIIEEFALRAVEGKVPIPLLGVRIMELDIAELTAGTRYRGDFEERLLGILEEVHQKKAQGVNIILFMDEFHHIIGSGQSTGMTLDGAGILKPVLARGEISCIGITTPEEYRKKIESDKAFLRRLQSIEVKEMSHEDTLLTLQKIKPQYESKHNVVFEDDALQEIIRLAEHYIFDRYFPDKAVDLLDEVGAYNQLKKFETPQELSDLYQQERVLLGNIREMISTLQTTVDYDVNDSEMDKAHELQDVMDRKEELRKSLLTSFKKNAIRVGVREVQEVVNRSTGIPIDSLDGDKIKVIKYVEEGLNNNVVGQKNALRTLLSTVKRSFSGLHRGTRPVGSFMFLGPTGVGKTHTAKKLAQFLLGSEDALTRFDMSDFSEPNSITRLIGAPPGYVGYEESGLLIKLVRKNPRQVLLFDEIEKADNKIFDVFLQILEEGKLQGQQGEYADFRHSIIIMTSNIGSKELQEQKRFGFTEGEYNDGYVESIVKEELHHHFRPEFINRLDAISVFTPLTQSETSQVVHMLISELSMKLKEQDIILKVHPSAKKLLQSEYCDIEYGVRSIRRGIREIENHIAELMIDQGISAGAGHQIAVSTKNNKFVVKQPQQALKPTPNLDEQETVETEQLVVE